MAARFGEASGAVARAAAPTAAAVALLGGVALVALLVIRLGPEWLTQTDGLDPVQEDEARGRVRTALFAMLAGLIAAIGAVYTARTYALNRRTSDRSHALDRAGHITDRFTRAVDQLGHNADSVRIGGIYALGAIANESQDYRATIVEILSAYVRLHAAGLEGPIKQDVQAAVLVLGRHRVEPDAPGETPAVLMEVNLREARIRGVHLEGARLRGTRLEHALLEDAWLTHADLAGAHLHDAKLQRADLTGAKLSHAQLHRTDLGGAWLEEANLWDVEFVDTDLRGAHLQRALFDDEVDLGRTVWDQLTDWPEGFNPRAHGAPEPMVSDL